MHSKKKAFKTINVSFITFIAYNLVYMLYMAGYLSRTANLIGIFMFILFHLHNLFNKKELKFYKEFKSILLIIISLFIISVLKQIYFMDFSFSRMNGLLNMFFSIFIAFLIINSTDENNKIDKYFYVILLRLIGLFLLQFHDILTLSNILSINFNDSLSSQFETSMAHDFLLLLFVFKMYKKKVLSIICVIFTLLSFKRLSFLLAVLLYFCFKFIPKKPVNKWIVFATKLFMLISPFVILFFYTTNVGNSMFYDIFKTNIYDFTTSRSLILTRVVNGMDYFAGFGAIGEWTTKQFGLLGSHCDLVRIYLECSVIGLFILVNNMFNVAKKNYYSFFAMTYCFLELVLSMLIEVMPTWQLLYLLIYLSESKLIEEGEVSNENICNNKACSS